MTNSFVLAQVNERAFWDKAYEHDPGDEWLKEHHSTIHQWLQENAVEYRILFEYMSPFKVAHYLMVRLEIDDDNDAVHFRLKWS